MRNSNAAGGTFPVTGESLAGIELLAELDLEARRDIAAISTGRRFAAGQTVVSHLDTSREVYFILGGTVEVSLFSREGKRVTFHEKGPGQVFGELAAIDGRTRAAHVIAKTSCSTASLAPADFIQLIDRHNDVSRRVLKVLAAQVRALSLRVFEFSSLCVNNRIHVELLRLAQAAESRGEQRRISPAPTHEELGSRVSTHREAVSRELSRLVRRGLITTGRDGWTITSISELEALVESSLGELPEIC